jgi:hypothetical protein
MNVTPTSQYYYSKENQTHPLPVSPEQSYLTFWKLGQSYWKQIIDGPLQQLTKWVFDFARHAGPEEPGYLSGIHEASHFASTKVINEKNAVEFYKKVHRLACAHFDGKSKSNTLIKGEETGKFRWDKDKQTKCAIHVDRLKLSKGVSVNKKIKQIQEEIDKFSKELGLESPLAEVKKESTFSQSIIFKYSFPNFEKTAQKIFDNFYETIRKSTTEEEKVVCIAKLYQLLEWLHPFPDGQGRTDLIILAKMLCDFGLNPAILQEPYCSTYCLLQEWVACLKVGMDQWKEKASAQSSDTKIPKTEKIRAEYKKRKKLYENVLFYDGKPFYDSSYIEKIRVELDSVEYSIISLKNPEERVLAIKKIIQLDSEAPDLLPKNEVRKRVRRLIKMNPESFGNIKITLEKTREEADKRVAMPSLDAIVQKHLTRCETYSKETFPQNLDSFYTEDYIKEIKEDLHLLEQCVLSMIDMRGKSEKLQEIIEKIITSNPPLLPYKAALEKAKALADRIPIDPIKQATLKKIKETEKKPPKKQQSLRKIKSSK